MQTIPEQAATLSCAVGRSRLIFPADELQHAAETILIGAGQIEQELQDYQVHLFSDLVAIAIGKGFQDADILRSLITHRPTAALVRELTREVIDLFGGPGDFWDAVDLITWPGEEGVRHD